MSQEQELIELRNKAGIELAKVKRELMNSFSTNTPYVVECDGMFITPALEKGVMIGKPLMHAFPTEAMTFSMADAEKVSVANEAGIKGKPILLRDALIKRGRKLSMIVNAIDKLYPDLTLQKAA